MKQKVEQEITPEQIMAVLDKIKWGRIIIVKEAGRILRIEKTEILKAEEISRI